MAADPAPRIRREPPPFRRLEVVRRRQRTPHLVRVTLAGSELDGYEPPEPAGSIRLLIADRPGAGLDVPVWNGNAFFHADGRRPVIRTLTPLRHDPVAGELDVDIVLHGAGPLSAWAERAQPGDPAAVSGPGRGYSVRREASEYVLAGDESAMPAIGQLVEALPPIARATVLVEVCRPDARVAMPERAGVELTWLDRSAGSAPGSALVDAVTARAIAPDATVWVAGEAAAVQRIRRHLFDDLGISRSRAVVRGYWKHGRSGDDDAA